MGLTRGYQHKNSLRLNESKNEIWYLNEKTISSYLSIFEK